MGKLGTINCAECGMACRLGEHHPYAACLMFKACQDSKVVRENLKAVMRDALGLAEGEEVFVEMEWRRKDGQVTFERSGMEGAPEWVQEADRRLRGRLAERLGAYAVEGRGRSTPAEAQAQGGGDMTECGHSKYDPCHNCEPLDAPPSAPVEVEAIVVAWVSRNDAMFTDAGNWRYTNPVLCSSQESPNMVPLYTAPLIQQPTAVDDAIATASDRDLLKMVAAAAGLKWRKDIEEERAALNILGLWITNQDGSLGNTAWNPLHSGSDAFHLAVELGISVCVRGDAAATRRAIVHAALAQQPAAVGVEE